MAKVGGGIQRLGILGMMCNDGLLVTVGSLM